MIERTAMRYLEQRNANTNIVSEGMMSEEESHCKELLTQMYVRYTNLVTKTSLAEIQRETSNKRRVIFVDCNYLID